MRLLAAAAGLNFITLVSISAGLFFVKKWIKETFEGERRWRCSVDGKFLVYFILLLIITLFQFAVTIYIDHTSRWALTKKVIIWLALKSDDFYPIIEAILFNNILNFVVNIFAIFMLEKMSKARWSIENNDTQEAKQTTQMDREVAAGFYD